MATTREEGREGVGREDWQNLDVALPSSICPARP